MNKDRILFNVIGDIEILDKGNKFILYGSSVKHHNNSYDNIEEARLSAEKIIINMLAEHKIYLKYNLKWINNKIDFKFFMNFFENKLYGNEVLTKFFIYNQVLTYEILETVENIDDYIKEKVNYLLSKICVSK